MRIILSSIEVRGGMGPDYWVATLRNGLAVEISDEGINVYATAADALGGKEPINSLVFPEPLTVPAFGEDPQPSTLN